MSINVGRVASDLSTDETRILRTFLKVPSEHIGDRLGCSLCKEAHLHLRRIALSVCDSTRTMSFRLVFADCLGVRLP
jgi:hypothetical protein